MSEQSEDIAKRLQAALWRIYRRPERPFPWTHSGNLPWNDPAFSERMLREHLDDSHGAASRNTAERTHQLRWLMEKLAIAPGKHVLDVTCGPGLYAVPLAQQGITVTGVDFSPAAIAYARDLAKVEGVADLCQFIEADIRDYAPETAVYDAALFLYGQLAVFPRHQAQTILTHLARALKPGGRLCMELLNQEKVDKTNSNWWFTDNTGLWGDTPFLHLGERFWLETEKISVERYLILHLESGQLDEIHLCDQTYAVSEMEAMMYQAGFQKVTVYPAWDGLPLYDADEWIVYVATR